MIEFGCEQRSGRREYFVRDNGVGFDPVFDILPSAPFRKHHAGEGVGMGLTLVERVVRRHGGELWAEGALDRGAKFSFRLGT